MAATVALASCNPGVAGMVIMPVLFNPCRYDGTLTIELSEVGRPNWGGTTVWLDRTVSRGFRGNVPGGTVEVAFTDGAPKTDMKLAGVPIEVYRGKERLAVPSKHAAIGRADGACGYAQVSSFDLSGLGPGTYWLVHRRSSGINGKVFCGQERCSWGTFDGEAALVTKLVLPGPGDRPALTPEEIVARVGPRLEQIQKCIEVMVTKDGRQPVSEEVVVDLRIVADRAYGIAEPPGRLAASEPVSYCIRQSFNYVTFMSRPVEPMIARCRIAVQAGGFKVASVETSIVEVTAASSVETTR